MTKDEMTTLLRGVGVNENTVTALCNAFDMGVEYEKDRVLAVIGDNQCECNCAGVVREEK